MSIAIHPRAHQQSRMEQWGRQSLEGFPLSLSPQFRGQPHEMLLRAAFLLQHPVSSQPRPLNPSCHRLLLVFERGRRGMKPLHQWLNLLGSRGDQGHVLPIPCGTTDPGTPFLGRAFLAVLWESGGIFTLEDDIMVLPWNACPMDSSSCPLR